MGCNQISITSNGKNHSIASKKKRKRPPVFTRDRNVKRRINKNLNSEISRSQHTNNTNKRNKLISDDSDIEIIERASNANKHKNKMLPPKPPQPPKPKPPQSKT